MKELLIELEESNIRWSKMQRQHHLSSIKWLWAQTLLFGGIGLYFCLVPLLFGGSWWYLFTGAIYGVMILFFWRWAYPRHRRALWQSVRQEAKARIRLKELARL